MPLRPTRNRSDRHLGGGRRLFTLLLVGLVSPGSAPTGHPRLAALVTCAVGFGFFYLLFPGGAHFGMTVANFLALYACLFVFFREANFPGAPRRSRYRPGFAGAGFPRQPASCAGGRWLGAIRARRVRELEHLPRLSGWVPGTLAIGAASFALPRLALDTFRAGRGARPLHERHHLLVALAVRDVVLLQMDIAMVFEGVAGRLDRLMMPVIAFLTLYASARRGLRLLVPYRGVFLR